LRKLKARGVGILFISHHLGEVFEICQTVTVLRDGQKTLDRDLNGLSQSELIEAMVGSARIPSARKGGVRDFSDAPVRIQLQDLRCRGAVEKISFTVHAGECLGLAGLAGSGKEAIGEAIAGLRPIDEGTIHLDGKRLPGGDVAKHNRAGIGFVPQDRHREGLILGMSVEDNATLTIPDKMGSLGILDPRRVSNAAQSMIRDLDIKVSDPRELVSTLSGGNQQKIVLARALARNPAALVLINPTSGVDVASKAALIASISNVAAQGTAVIVISDELDELELCDRVLIIRSQRMGAEFLRPFGDREIVTAMEGAVL
jgi:simple sugar transport system ATP-binding protein